MKTGIYPLSDENRDELTAHLLALDEEDRYFRFFSRLSDSLIVSFVQHLKMKGIYGYYVFGKLAAVSFVMPESDDSAEFAVSVDKRWRGHGFAKVLLKHSVATAEASNLDRLVIHHLRENQAMAAVSRSLPATSTRGGSEVDVSIDVATLRDQELFAQGLLCGSEA